MKGGMKDPRTLNKLRALLARATTALTGKVGQTAPQSYYLALANVPGLAYPMPPMLSPKLDKDEAAAITLRLIQDATVYEERSAAYGWGQDDPRVSFDLKRRTYADSDTVEQSELFGGDAK